MEYAMFRKFMEFFRTRIGNEPTWDDLKVYIKGGYTIRVGKHMFQYNWKTGEIEEV